jgi:GT2 family glycosyltransferase
VSEPGDLSAVVVAWNAGDELAACVQALRASAANAGARVQVVVVDNASTDDAAEALSLARPDVLVRNPVNAGYGVAAAQGMSRATAAWILLLNPDCRVAEGFVGALLDAAAAAPDDVATLVPDMRFASRASIVNCRGIAVDDSGVPHEIGTGLPAERAAMRDPPFGGSSGCCLVRAEALRQVGGVEPVFFAYLEDVDLAWQLRRAAFSAVFVPGAVALHEGSASTGEGSPLKTYLVARNRRLLFRLNGPHTLRARTVRTVVEVGHAVVSTLSGSGLAPWRGRVAALALRRYTRFVRLSRTAARNGARDVRLSPRPSLRETLRRKRATAGHVYRQPAGADDPDRRVRR